MKVGILAMCREGVAVRMETNQTQRDFYVDSSNICYHQGIRLDMAENMLVRLTAEAGVLPLLELSEFMLLDAPGALERNSIIRNTPDVGDLLLQCSQRGKLYVNGFLAQHREPDGQIMGYNVPNLKINRDRNSSTSLKEMRTAFARIWNASVLHHDQHKAGLACRTLLDILTDHKGIGSDDVSFIGNSPVFTAAAAKAVGSLFASRYPPNIFPVSSKATNEERELVENFLGKVPLTCEKRLYGRQR